MSSPQLKPKRFTVGFEASAMAAIEHVIRGTNYRTLPDVVRASVSVFVDLLDAEDRNLEIVLRDGAGNEWKYSPHKPGRATPLPTSNDGNAGIVLRPNFGGSPVDALRFGSAALPSFETGGPAADAANGSSRKRTTRD
jgi:hypothetical protein